jgi:hypothetical protein
LGWPKSKTGTDGGEWWLQGLVRPSGPGPRSFAVWGPVSGTQIAEVSKFADLRSLSGLGSTNLHERGFPDQDASHFPLDAGFAFRSSNSPFIGPVLAFVQRCNQVMQRRQCGDRRREAPGVVRGPDS